MLNIFHRFHVRAQGAFGRGSQRFSISPISQVDVAPRSHTHSFGRAPILWIMAMTNTVTPTIQANVANTIIRNAEWESS
jgi:hypothetical protein